MKVIFNLIFCLFVGFILFFGFMWAITPEKDENGNYYSAEYILFGKE